MLLVLIKVTTNPVSAIFVPPTFLAASASRLRILRWFWVAFVTVWCSGHRLWAFSDLDRQKVANVMYKFLEFEELNW